MQLLGAASSCSLFALQMSPSQASPTWLPMNNSYGAVWERSSLPALPLDVRIAAANPTQTLVAPGAISAAAPGDYPTTIQLQPSASLPSPGVPPATASLPDALAVTTSLPATTATPAPETPSLSPTEQRVQVVQPVPPPPTPAAPAPPAAVPAPGQATAALAAALSPAPPQQQAVAPAAPAPPTPEANMRAALLPTPSVSAPVPALVPVPPTTLPVAAPVPAPPAPPSNASGPSIFPAPVSFSGTNGLAAYPAQPPAQGPASKGQVAAIAPAGACSTLGEVLGALPDAANFLQLMLVRGSALKGGVASAAKGREGACFEQHCLPLCRSVVQGRLPTSRPWPPTERGT